MNKSILLSICLALPVVSNAATLYFDSADNIALSNGTLMTTGNIEFGYFDPSTDFAVALFYSGDIPGALDQIDTVVEVNPDFQTAWLNRGIFTSHEGRIPILPRRKPRKNGH